MNEKLYGKILNATKYGIYCVDTQRKIVHWNKAAEAITGYSFGEVRGSYCQDNLLQHTDVHGNPLCSVGCPLFQTIKDGKTREADVLLRHKNGTYIPITVSILPIYEEGDCDKIIGAVESFYPTTITPADSDSFDSFLQGLIAASRTDLLTCLPNRRTVESYISYCLENYRRSQIPFSLLYVDIDNFKYFNDTYGHDTGDAVLKAIAGIFKTSIRQNDIFGRWGGEEFIGVFQFDGGHQASQVAERIRAEVEAMEILHGNQIYHVTISAGLTTVRPGDDVEGIINRADKLMYHSKNNGRNQIITSFDERRGC